MIMYFRSFVLLTGALLTSALANAHDYKAGNLYIGHPYAHATVPGQISGAAYLTIENKGKQLDKLIAIESSAANAVEIHTMSMHGNVMRMRQAPAIEFKPASKIIMQPGSGYHIMLIGLKKPLKIGDKFPLTLTFEKSGKSEVSVWVEEKKEKMNKEAGTHHHH
jgi:periplasmic copper chaperone A